MHKFYILALINAIFKQPRKKTKLIVWIFRHVKNHGRSVARWNSNESRGRRGRRLWGRPENEGNETGRGIVVNGDISGAPLTPLPHGKICEGPLAVEMVPDPSLALVNSRCISPESLFVCPCAIIVPLSTISFFYTTMLSSGPSPIHHERVLLRLFRREPSRGSFPTALSALWGC